MGIVIVVSATGCRSFHRDRQPSADSTLRSFIDVATMANLGRQNSHGRVCYLANRTIVTNTKSPETGKLTGEQFSSGTRILQIGDIALKIIENSDLPGPFDSCKLFFRGA